MSLGSFTAGHTNSVNLSKIQKSVGKGCTNSPLDVLVIQRLLNASKVKFTNQKKLKADGLYGPNTGAQIRYYQKFLLKYNHIDGKVDPRGKMLKHLVDHADSNFIFKHYFAAQTNQKKVIDINRFINLYKRQYSTDKNTIALQKLVQTIMNDPFITDFRWVAYMLATVKRECAGTWKPIEEYGKGRGRSYDVVVPVVDPKTNITKNNVYYGRGYVQITWEENYRKLGQAIGIGDDLRISPEKALDHDYAYKIMSIGMRKGLFSNASLPQFLSGNTSNYLGARRIINGTDHNQEIATFAIAYEQLLKASVTIHDHIQSNTQRYANYA